MLREWPLVAFTIAGQMSVGVFLVAGLPLLLSAAAGVREPGLGVLAVVIGLLVVATLSSFFHLHHPLRARRALANLKTSWLSREILFELAFGALVVLIAFLAWGKRGQVALIKGVSIAAGLAGVMFLLSMIRIYMLETLPAWNQAFTLLSFFLTSLSLGALAAALAGSSGQEQILRPELFTPLAFFLVGVDAAAAYLLAPGYGRRAYRPGPSLRAPAGLPSAASRTRLVLSIAAVALLGAGLVAAGGRSWLLVAGGLLALAGQVVGRFLFYGLLVRPRNCR